ncbi:hypothetical protein DOY81_007501 [Sarcophaga bullata]|nr:hypothetical protein DOY81_007501 [Sarcophaga bullata]
MNNNNSDSISQSIPNTISSGSGDDHLLTAHADNDFNKNYHDNRAFQFHNNNSLKRNAGKALAAARTALQKEDDKDKNGLDVLDVVIVHKGYRNLKEEANVGNNICSCKQQQLQLLSEPRKRHNATQTPTSLINWEPRSAGERRSRKTETHKANYCCGRHNCNCLAAAKRNQKDYCNCTEVQRCQHHCQHNVVTPTSHSYCCCSMGHHSHCHSRHQHKALMPSDDKGAIAPGLADFGRWPICAKDRSFKRHIRCSSGRHNRPPHIYHLHKKHCSSVGHLPNTYTKSSLDSSDDQTHQRLSTSGALQEIAIEIDAATMTEDNTTTATSNFAFKMAADSALAPIIRAPIHVDSDDGGRGKRLKRRSSFNSNTTIETDELSNEEIMDNDIRGGVPCYCHCCDHARMTGGDTLAIKSAQNECVKIKRKRFIPADDYCSSCSRCSSCSCSHVHSSSCSSFEEWPLEGRHSVRSAPHASHAFTVSADCHHCHPQRQSSHTSTDDLEMPEHEHDLNGEIEGEGDMPPQPLVQETTDSSARTSRRSSVSISFCSCNSNTCCYCSGSCEDSHTTHMCTARDATIASLTLGKLGPFEGEEGHSSTLTPLTNPSSVVSTPGDDGDVTIRSLSNALSEDTSSQSHSAEYFSLSSNNQMSQGTPRKLPINNSTVATTDAGVPNVAVTDNTSSTNPNTTTTNSQGDDTENGHKSRKPCKHYSKHHRHKRVDSPLDSYL